MNNSILFFICDVLILVFVVCYMVMTFLYWKRTKKLERVVFCNSSLLLDTTTALVNVKRLTPEAKIPAFKHRGDAGADISSIEAMTIAPGKFAKVRTGIAVELKYGHELQFRPRSGLASRGILCSFGTVDSGYRGEICGIIYNHSDEPFEIKPGDRIAQVVVKPTMLTIFNEVDELKPSDRGTDGFGSTGK